MRLVMSPPTNPTLIPPTHIPPSPSEPLPRRRVQSPHLHHKHPHTLLQTSHTTQSQKGPAPHLRQTKHATPTNSQPKPANLLLDRAEPRCKQHPNHSLDYDTTASAFPIHSYRHRRRRRRADHTNTTIYRNATLSPSPRETLRHLRSRGSLRNAATARTSRQYPLVHRTPSMVQRGEERGTCFPTTYNTVPNYPPLKALPPRSVVASPIANPHQTLPQTRHYFQTILLGLPPSSPQWAEEYDVPPEQRVRSNASDVVMSGSGNSPARASKGKGKEKERERERGKRKS
jgi:hypothetical protein